MPKNMSLQIAYVANHGTRIDIAQNINQPRIYGQSGTYDPFNVAFGKTASVTQYFMGFSSNYESMQAQLTRRFTNGLAFNSAFTWGKAQGYQTGAQDGNVLFWSGNLRRNYNLLDFDRKKNFEQTVTYELPAGRRPSLLQFRHRRPMFWAAGRFRRPSGCFRACLSRFQQPAVRRRERRKRSIRRRRFQVTHSVAGGKNPALAWFNPASFAAPPACVAYSASNPESMRSREYATQPVPRPGILSQTTCRSSRASQCSASPRSKPASMHST